MIALTPAQAASLVSATVDATYQDYDKPLETDAQWRARVADAIVRWFEDNGFVIRRPS